jgi:hypothetical protein
MTSPTWEELTRTLAERLTRLDDGDVLSLRHGDYYTQCQMAEKWLDADVVSNHHLPPEHHLSAEQEERLRADGWLPPDPPNNFNWHVTVPVLAPMPLTDDDGLRLATMMVGALRDVFKIESPDLVQGKAFNALY